MIAKQVKRALGAGRVLITALSGGTDISGRTDPPGDSAPDGVLLLRGQ